MGWPIYVDVAFPSALCLMSADSAPSPLARDRLIPRVLYVVCLPSGLGPCLAAILVRKPFALSIAVL